MRISARRASITVSIFPQPPPFLVFRYLISNLFFLPLGLFFVEYRQIVPYIWSGHFFLLDTTKSPIPRHIVISLYIFEIILYSVDSKSLPQLPLSSLTINSYYYRIKVHLINKQSFGIDKLPILFFFPGGNGILNERNYFLFAHSVSKLYLFASL